MNISVITPSIRPQMLPVVARCLKRQTVEYEWLIGAPDELFLSIDRQIGHDSDFIFVPEPPKREGDYYNLNKCWNSIFKKCEGELIVSLVDGLWFPPDTLERLLSHYNAHPRALVSCIGHQYDKMENGKPEHRIWTDPRQRSDYGSFYEVAPTEMELCIASIPKQAIIDVGGVDEEFDKYAALSEKEMCFRMDTLGYKFYLDQTIEYRAIAHPRLSSEWDKKYLEGSTYYYKCLDEIKKGTRVKLDFLSKKD